MCRIEYNFFQAMVTFCLFSYNYAFLKGLFIDTHQFDCFSYCISFFFRMKDFISNSFQFVYFEQFSVNFHILISNYDIILRNLKLLFKFYISRSMTISKKELIYNRLRLEYLYKKKKPGSLLIKKQWALNKLLINLKSCLF